MISISDEENQENHNIKYLYEKNKKQLKKLAKYKDKLNG